MPDFTEDQIRAWRDAHTSAEFADLMLTPVAADSAGVTPPDVMVPEAQALRAFRTLSHAIERAEADPQPRCLTREAWEVGSRPVTPPFPVGSQSGTPEPHVGSQFQTPQPQAGQAPAAGGQFFTPTSNPQPATPQIYEDETAMSGPDDDSPSPMPRHGRRPLAEIPQPPVVSDDETIVEDASPPPPPPPPNKRKRGVTDEDQNDQENRPPPARRRRTAAPAPTRVLRSATAPREHVELEYRGRRAFKRPARR